MHARVGTPVLILGIALSTLLAACGSAAPPVSSASSAKASAAASTSPSGGALPSLAASRAGTAASAANASAPAASGLTTLHHGGLGSTGDVGLYLASDRGYFAEQRIAVDYVRFGGGLEIVAPLSTGQIDLSSLSVQAGLLSAIGRGVDVKIVAGQSSTVPGRGTVAFLVRKDVVDGGRFKGPSDLKGLVFALSPPVDASAASIVLDRWLAQAKLTRADFKELKVLGFGDMPGAFANKAIDAAISIEPFVATAVSQGFAVRVAGVDEVYPGQQQGVISFGPSLLKRDDLARGFMVAYLKGVRDYSRAVEGKADMAPIYETLARYTSLKDPALAAKVVPTGADPDGKLNLQSLIDDQQYYIDHKTLQAPVDLRKLIDTSYAEAAVKTLGPYR
ncbi:MAG TPA: ABC transporter substrate-binding protein [Chloroflexota bacterium]|nr:ABC transporter substrate-binding protein [Chloroflexota bacterium]